MRYLTSVAPSLFADIERSASPARLRPLPVTEESGVPGGERFAAIIVDHHRIFELLRSGIPVILLARLDRDGIRAFRSLAEDRVDVRLWTDPAGLTQATLELHGGIRAMTPAARILAAFRGRHGLAASDVIASAAVLATGRRSVDHVAKVAGLGTSGARNALKDEGLPSIAVVVAWMRALHCIWAWESGRQHYWSAGGFKTSADLSSHLSAHAGASLGRWRVPGGFDALLAVALRAAVGEEHLVAAAG